jgi:hypothetical protein
MSKDTYAGFKVPKEILMAGDKRTHGDNMHNMMNMMTAIPFYRNSPIGQIIFGLVMSRLHKKAREEEGENIQSRARAFEEYQKKSFAEKVELARQKHELEQERQREAEAREQKKWERDTGHRKSEDELRYQRDLEKEERARRHQEQRDAEARKHSEEHTRLTKDLDAKRAEEELRRKTVSKSFENPAEALEWLSDPEAEQRRETFDNAGFWDRFRGRQKIQSRLKPKPKTKDEKPKDNKDNKFIKIMNALRK